MDWAVVASLIGGLGIGSTVNSFLTSGHSRREVRSAVLDRLIAVEQARWAGPPEPIMTHTDFLLACQQLETAALIARVPRSAVMHYLTYAHAARLCSEANWERWEEQEIGGFLSADIGAAVHEAAETLTQLIWRPWLSRVRLGKRIEKEHQRAINQSDAEDRKHIETAQRRIVGPTTTA